ncbi:MAG: CoA transferase, partial [Lachnospiraceae bacterium]|nr:CoA transferase [Lachnospiraceae bacterium]
AIKDWLKNYDKFTAMDILCKADIPAGALLSVDDITNDDQYYGKGRDIMVEVEHPERGKVKIPGFAPKFSGFDVEYKCSPKLGGSNDEVYKDLLGYTDEQLAAFKEKGAI